MAVGGPWPGSPPEDPAQQQWEERDAHTEPEVPSNAGLGFCFGRAVGAAAGAPYRTVQRMTAVGVKSCYIMRGGSGGGGAALENVGHRG